MNSIPNLKLLSDVVKKMHNLHIVRYRKPFWMPRAKSKMFKIPPRIVIPLEEVVELKRLHNNYRTHRKSLRAYLVSEWQEKSEETVDHKTEKNQFVEDFQKMSLINQEWNDKLKPLRERFIEDELRNDLDVALATIEETKVNHNEHYARIEELVRQTKEDSKHFITAENIDTSIDQLLEINVEFNYALNLNGEKIVEYPKCSEKSVSVQ